MAPDTTFSLSSSDFPPLNFLINQSYYLEATTQQAQLISLSLHYPGGREVDIASISSFTVPKHQEIGVASFTVEVFLTVSLNGVVSKAKL